MGVTWLACLAFAFAQVSEYPTYQLTKEAHLQYQESAILELTDPGTSSFGQSLPRLSFNAYYETDSILHIRITDAEAERWDPDNYPIRTQARQPAYDLQLQSQPFSFTVLREGNTLFASQGVDGAPALYFADTYLELSTALPGNPNIYGLGERVTRFRLDTDETRYAIWALHRTASTTLAKKVVGEICMDTTRFTWNSETASHMECTFTISTQWMQCFRKDDLPSKLLAACWTCTSLWVRLLRMSSSNTSL